LVEICGKIEWSLPPPVPFMLALMRTVVFAVRSRK
jgi:hypothetical protein